MDCDSFFASVEQQLDPALRGRAIAVAPVGADTGTCIVVSYEGKRFGVKTGTKVREARADQHFTEPALEAFIKRTAAPGSTAPPNLIKR